MQATLLPLSAAPESRRQAAEALNTQIDKSIRSASNQLAQAYLDLAALLKQMHDSGAFRLIAGGEYATWGAYLASKQEYGRTYLSYLWKLAHAGDLRRFVDEGVSASKLVEVAKHTDYPERIPALLEATWGQIRDLTVREAGRHVREYVDAHPATYKRPRKASRRGRPRTPLSQRLRRQFEAIPGAQERDQFLSQVRIFLEAELARASG